MIINSDMVIIMNRATSKASYRTTRESGQELSQSDKILGIIQLGGDLSLQEIMKIYRGNWGNIELSSVSARCNKLKEEEKIIEAAPRKCAITGKTVNPLTAKKCTHDKYRSKDYMMYSNAAKAHDRGEIKIIGTLVINCEDCGADISHAKRVKVKKIENKINEKKVEVKKYNVVIRGKKSSMICYDGETIEEAEKVCKLKFGDAFEEISE